MLRIARETNAPETAFVLASDKADVRVRYFMPRGEIPFAGHPTIATGHLLRELGVLKPGTARFEFAIGVLPVDIHPDRVIMTQPPAVTDTCADAGTTAQALGLQASDLREGLPCQLMRGGVSFLMVPVRELAGAPGGSTWTGPPSKLFWRPSACRRRTCSPPKAWSLKRMCTPGLSIRTTPGKILSPDRPPGCMASYMHAHGLCSGTRIRLEQGHILDRPGTGELELILASDRGKLDAVRLGGTAVSSASGTLRW